jgi:hypothetical protein
MQHQANLDQSKMEFENKQLLSEVKSLEKEAKTNEIKIDSLKNVDVVYVDKIKVIKETLVKELRVIDSLPHSGIEKFFADRYNSKDSVTFVPESVARQTAAELVNCDAIKQIASSQEERINNFIAKDNVYESQLGIKDTIISKQKIVIGNQQTIINKSKGLKFNTFLGLSTNGLSTNEFNLYTRAIINIKKINFGIQYNIQPSNYNLILEYKLF